MKFWIAYVKIESFLILAALPGAQPWKGLRPNKATEHMTRRAFLALRVIQRQGEFDLKGLVKKWCK